ncbi:hypothetical protein GQ53DRAFT_842939 [Thozetella sp. PMI_491]|nr:hypothetical protein GQ53DRAFT_842939 [Thozetella sp. PMI_491]
MASNTKATLVKQFNIHFDGPVDAVPKEGWPTTRQAIVEHIQKLGKQEYHQYQESISYDVLHRPWREQVRRRATRTVELAKSCLNGRKNEAGWRFSVEAEVMARLSIEVACLQCRGRLWRSEQEVEPSSWDEEVARKLGERQQNREPCVCDANEPLMGAREAGINRIFDDRLDEGIMLPPEVTSKFAKREERPDRVYGLRATSRLQRLLQSADKRGGSLGDGIKGSPFREGGEPNLFPFLLIEAKSAKGTDSFGDIEVQTSFSIRELLNVQENLRAAADEDPNWDAGPLVWFFSYKGERWRVSMAYTEVNGPEKYYRVVELWRGEVDLPDKALQLLLIVDYVFDWARDVYREAIIQSLRKLVVSDTRSLAYDSDIYSMADRLQFWSSVEGFHDQVSSAEPETSVQDALRLFDTRKGAIRDIRYIQSRLVGVHLTQDNVEYFFNSTDTQKESRTLARSLLNLMVESWRVKPEALDSVELRWTGRDRERVELSQENKKYLVVATVSAYLTIDWEQTRELSYIAVEDTAMEVLLKHAGVKLREDHVLSDFPFVDTDTFERHFISLLHQSPRDNLMAAMARVCLSTGVISTNRAEYKDAFSVTSIEKSDVGVTYRLDAVMKPDSLAGVREFVQTLHDQYKIGRNEPVCPFLRVSSVLDELGLPEDSPPRRRTGRWKELSWFIRPPDVPETVGVKVLFAVSSNSIAGPSFPRLCLFVVDPAGIRVNGSQFQDLMQSEPGWHFRVKRFDRRKGWSNGWNFDFEKLVTRNQNILPMLTEFVRALQALELRPSPDEEIARKDAIKKTWGPKKPNTQWDILTADGLEFMLDAYKSTTTGSYSDLTASRGWQNPRGMREVRREDTPRRRLGSTPQWQQREGSQRQQSIVADIIQMPPPARDLKGKQREVIPSAGQPSRPRSAEAGDGTRGLDPVGISSSESIAHNREEVLTGSPMLFDTMAGVASGLEKFKERAHQLEENLLTADSGSDASSAELGHHGKRVDAGSSSRTQKRHRSGPIEVIDLTGLDEVYEKRASKLRRTRSSGNV